jgi:hypothetical protein
VEAIGGNTPKFIEVAEASEEEAFARTSVRLNVANPHAVVIGELVVEVRDGKIHVTLSPDQVDVIVHRNAQ